jgi:hypothetical protein
MVTGTTFWEQGGSKLGTDDLGRPRFEPRDIKKGDIARGLFYFATRYGNIDDYLTDQEELLRSWAENDPIDQWELDRGNGIFEMQANRNPFIDNPSYLDQIPSISLDKDVERASSIAFSGDEITIDMQSVKDLPETINIYIPLLNSGLEDVTVFSASTNNEAISVSDFPTDIEVGDLGNVELTLKNMDATAQLSIATSAGLFTKTINTFGKPLSINRYDADHYTITNNSILFNKSMKVIITDLSGRVQFDSNVSPGQEITLNALGPVIISSVLGTTTTTNKVIISEAK